MKRDTYTVSRNRLVGGWDVVNPTILVEPEHLVIFPSRGRHHRVIVPRRSIEHIEISEPHGSVVAHRVAVVTKINSWLIDMMDDDGGVVAERVARWWLRS